MSVVRRFKLATVLNVLGLSVAFVAFMLIMMQVSYDNRFDSCQPKAERIFRFDLGNRTFPWLFPRESADISDSLYSEAKKPTPDCLSVEIASF